MLQGAGLGTPVARALAAFLVLFVLISTGLRSQFDLSYNDTPDTAGTIPLLRAEGLSLLNWAAFVPAEPGEHRPDALRPLQTIWRQTAVAVYLQHGIFLPAFLVFALLGLSAWWMFRLFSHFGDEHWAAIAAGAFVTVPSVVSPSWIPMNGPQALVPGVFALGLGTYLAWLKAPMRKHLVILCACCVIGPLFKETLSLLSLLVIAHHAVYVPRRSWAFLAMMSVFALHGLFPSFLPALVLFGKVHVLSIFHQGALHDHIAPKTYRHPLFADLSALFPPSLLCVVLAGMVLATRRVSPTTGAFGTSRAGELLTGLVRHALTACATAALALRVIALVGNSSMFERFLPELTIVSFILYAILYVDVILAGWALVIIGPLSFIYFNVTQCSYAIAPLVYCAVHVTGWLAGQLATVAEPQRQVFLRRGLAAVVVVASIDNGLSLVNSTLAYSALADFNVQVARAVEQQLPGQRPQSYVHLSNTVASDDAFALNSRLRNSRGLYTFQNGVPPERVITDPEQLVAVSREKDLVLVKAEHGRAFKKIYWEITQVEGLFSEPVRARCRFVALFVDPLRLRCDNRYRSVLCPPDYQDEFARRRRFLHESMSNEFEISVCRRGCFTLVALGESLGSPPGTTAGGAAGRESDTREARNAVRAPGTPSEPVRQ